MNDILLDIASPPDREKVVIQMMVGSEQIAEVNQESESLQIEIYGRRDGHPWVLDYESLVLALQKAKTRLITR